ncbi:MAG: serine/threonine protein kinase [Vulcanimicrobiota bacterium]
MMEKSPQKKPLIKREPVPFFPVLLPAMIPGSMAILFSFPVVLMLFYGAGDELLHDVIIAAIAVLGYLASWSVYRRRRRAVLLSICFFFSLFLLMLNDVFFFSIEPFLLFPGLQLIALLSLFFSRQKSAEIRERPVIQEPNDKESSSQLYSPGTVVRGRYRIERPLAAGATGEVFLVEDLKFEDRKVKWVMKVLHSEGLTHEEEQDLDLLFHRESELLSSLNHPSIPKMIESFREGNCCCVIMESVEGENLDRRIARTGTPLSPQEAVEVAKELVKILEYLHGKEPHPLIYRDLKPSNIIITGRGKIKLIDFGIARYHAPEKERDTMVYGTPGFSPPEQYGTGQTDARSDIYALGATLYYLLTSIDLQQFYFNIPPLSAFNRSVPPPLEKVIMRCLRRSPDDRYQSVESLKDDLDRAVELLEKTDETRGRDFPFWLLLIIGVAGIVFSLAILSGEPMDIRIIAAISIAALLLRAVILPPGLFQRRIRS